MALTFPNIYHHRKVANTAAKACEICYKLSTSVLVTPDKKDFFYTCPEHLKQPAFCKPIVDQAAIDARKKKELDEEVERVKKEYEERQRKKKEKGKDEKSDEKDRDKDKDKKEEDGDKKDDSKKASPSPDGEKEDEPKPEEEPRVFELYRTFYQDRLARKRQAEVDKRSRERFADPNLFPSVPKGQP